MRQPPKAARMYAASYGIPSIRASIASACSSVYTSFERRGVLRGISYSRLNGFDGICSRFTAKSSVRRITIIELYALP